MSGARVTGTRKRKNGDGSGAASPATDCGNRLLAGYLAHEFLTCGTLLGRPLDRSRPAVKAGSVKEPLPYADVAYLLRGGGAHIPGVVNPTQLARWLQNNEMVH
ncbi:uncharacterized protein [Typha angustifolia]|uniref:uncharacterized protein n=1 Tax=Typha angustifolia TaxID=59011 RepID=UPI003C2DDC7B